MCFDIHDAAANERSCYDDKQVIVKTTEQFKFPTSKRSN